jgi:hypothetical protein
METGGVDAISLSPELQKEILGKFPGIFDKCGPLIRLRASHSVVLDQGKMRNDIF